mmetsp:Transcript_58240/g.120388  ORF Transcript_58240/g.120388 Transcript_58240/m.120388 type:complete len:153 (+) Transcript_58240:70-528(+)
MGIRATACCDQDHFSMDSVSDHDSSPWFTSFARREERKKYPGTRKLRATSKRGKPYQLFKAWSQEVGDAARQAMIAARNAELAAGQAKRYKYFAKSARDAAQNALQELVKHFAKDRADASKMRVFFSTCVPVLEASWSSVTAARRSRMAAFL